MIPGEEVHIHLGPEVLEDFSDNLRKRSLKHEILVDNQQAMIDKELKCCSRDSGDNFDTCYHTLEQVIFKYLSECCSRDSGVNFDTCYHTITQVSFTCLISAVHVTAGITLTLVITR